MGSTLVSMLCNFLNISVTLFLFCLLFLLLSGICFSSCNYHSIVIAINTLASQLLLFAFSPTVFVVAKNQVFVVANKNNDQLKMVVLFSLLS